jgi:hypothetical protein
MKFCSDAKKEFNERLKKPMQTQAYAPSTLADSVYKFYEEVSGAYVYRCTVTHVSNKLVVVLHALSENLNTKYRAVNVARTIDFKGKDMIPITEELGVFPVNGFKPQFTVRNLVPMKESGIITVLGYGHGVTSSPEAMIGFASPLGWCNAATRNGDCSSPVLDVCGNIVGFWTHGIEQNATSPESFGRFDPVTQHMIGMFQSNNQPMHMGLDFQSRPRNQ